MIEEVQIPVLYQDEHLIIVDKPADVLSVPGRGPDKQDCVISRVINQGFTSAKIVHRLDYATSGLMVIALTPETHKALSLLFQNRKTEKTYEAIIHQCPTEDNGIITEPLRCDWERRPLQIVDYEHGKPSTTHWKILERMANKARVELTPITGRSHQLRVHMQWLGHPILGDHFYAEEDIQKAADRLLLHAKMLSFVHPQTHVPMHFTSAPSF